MKCTLKVLAVIIGCTPSCLSSAAEQVSADIRVARLAVKELLKDPDSARFRLEFTTNGAVCGRVNARNSYGGYAGEKSYVYVRTTRQVAIVYSISDTTDEGQRAWDLMLHHCHN
jgi:hypothetical protein